jgi:hypothetical protein
VNGVISARNKSTGNACSDDFRALVTGALLNGIGAMSPQVEPLFPQS